VGKSEELTPLLGVISLACSCYGLELVSHSFLVVLVILVILVYESPVLSAASAQTT